MLACDSPKEGDCSKHELNFDRGFNLFLMKMHDQILELDGDDDKEKL